MTQPDRDDALWDGLGNPIPAIPDPGDWPGKTHAWQQGWGDSFRGGRTFEIDRNQEEYNMGFGQGIEYQLRSNMITPNQGRDLLGVKEYVSGEVRTVSSTGGEKGVKPARYDLVPIRPIELLAILYGKGAEKYAAHNYRKGYEWSKSYAAAMRHLTLFWNGEDMDEEMGLPHLTCAMFHLCALVTFMEEHPEFDDRYRPEPEENLNIKKLYDQASRAMSEYKGDSGVIMGSDGRDHQY